jgi:intein/homing endonuclease
MYKNQWEIIDSYLNSEGSLAEHQLASYNQFIETGIPNVIESCGNLVVKNTTDETIHTVSFSNPLFILPVKQLHEYHNMNTTKECDLLPLQATTQNLTYAGNLVVDIRKIVVNKDKTLTDNTQRNVTIAKIPVMVGSKFCHTTNFKYRDVVPHNEFDYKSYFIIKGQEKVVISQERLADNQLFIFEKKNSNKYTYYSEFRSIHPISKIVYGIYIRYTKNKTFRVKLPQMKEDMCLISLFYLMTGWTNKDILECVDKDSSFSELLQDTFIHALHNYSKEVNILMSAIQLKTVDLEEITKFLDRILLPHLGENILKRFDFLCGTVLRELLKGISGHRDLDDRDHLANKRIDTAGVLMTGLFRQAYQKFLAELSKEVLNPAQLNISRMIKPSIIGNAFNYALSTGNWTTKNGNLIITKVGVAQMLDRFNHISSLSHIRRVTSDLDTTSKLDRPRQLHSSYAFGLCVTGDTEILQSDGTLKLIKNMNNGDTVTTINPKTLQPEPSRIKDYFSRMPEKLLQITTSSGRSIKCTPEHPFLIGDKWVSAENLRKADLLKIKFHTIYIENEYSTPHEVYGADKCTELFIDKELIDTRYFKELLENGLIGNISYKKSRILAGLLGAVMTDGTLLYTTEEYYTARFCVGEEEDILDIMRDIQDLGFSVSLPFKTTNTFTNKLDIGSKMTTYNLTKGGTFAYLLAFLGGIIGKKTTHGKIIPQWLMNASLATKREFLSAFQGGDGCVVSIQQNGTQDKIQIASTTQSTNYDSMKENVEYFNQIAKMFSCFDISCNVHCHNNNRENDRQHIKLYFNQTQKNILKLGNIIGYKYCGHKHRRSIPIIEYFRTKEYDSNKRINVYKNVVKLYESGKMISEISKEVNITTKQLSKFLTRYKRYGTVTAKNTEFMRYTQFLKECRVESYYGDIIHSPIDSIEEIEPELVYDYTTISDAHVMIGNNIISHQCSSETPEGGQIGISKNLALGSSITTGTSEIPIISTIKNLLEEYTETGSAKVFVNYRPIGNCDTKDLMKLVEKLRGLRRKGYISKMTNIFVDYSAEAVFIQTDPGRVYRACIIVSKITPEFFKAKTITELLDIQAIDFIDTKESENCLIAMNFDDLRKFPDTNYTHLELHPCMLLGVAAGLIPFVNHNQSPRVSYQASMCKQAIGMYSPNYRKEFETSSFILWNPQRPLVSTKMSKILGNDTFPSGMNLIIAFCCYTGYNIEDQWS